jgi:hypothetical protein
MTKWQCDLCGLSLENPVEPVRHHCKALAAPCVHRGEKIRDIECSACHGKRLWPVLSCSIHGETVLRKIADDKLYELQLMSCERCIRRGLGFSPPANSS